MFNIGPMELIVILLAALIVVGPKSIPEVGRSIGKSLREFRRATDEVRYSFQADLDDIDRPSYDEPDGKATTASEKEPDTEGAETPRAEEPPGAAPVTPAPEEAGEAPGTPDAD